MKALIFVTAMMIAGTASAALDSIKICDSEGHANSMSLVIHGTQGTVTLVSSGRTTISNMPITESINLSKDLLAGVSTAHKDLPELTEGQIHYVKVGAGLLIAQDAKNVKYVFHVFGTLLQYIGSSESCN